jgi:hypothetical protein
MITANTLNTLILHRSTTHAVVQGTLVVNGAFAGLANAALVNAIAIPGATMTLTTNGANAANFAVGDVLTGNTSAAVGTILSIEEDEDVYTIVVEMTSGTFGGTEVVDSDSEEFETVDTATNNAKVAVESIEWATSGTVELSYANNEPIAAFTGAGKSHHTWVKRGADADPNVLLTTRGVASNGAATVIVTVRKLAGYTENY